MPKLLTVKEVVGRLLERGIQRSSPTIYRWVEEGVFRNVRRLPEKNSVLIPEDEVERFLREEDFS